MLDYTNQITLNIKKQKLIDNEIEYKIILNNQNIGIIAKGWLRLGGWQWIVYCKKLELNQTGYKTLKECKQALIGKINKGSKYFYIGC